MEITVNSQQAITLFNRLSGFSRRPPMRAVAAEMDQAARKAFRTETDPWGTPWPPHSPLTLRARRRRGSASHDKLIDSGAMYGTMRSDHTDTSASVSIGAGLPDPRARVQQFGADDTGRGRNTRVPARPFFPLESETAAPPQQWWQTVMAPVEKALEEAEAATA